MKVGCVFPGQGIQEKNMGLGLYSSSEKYMNILNEASSVLDYDLLQIVKDGDLLMKTEYAQGAILVFNHITFLNYLDNFGVMPEYFIGHSLGEYNALVAAKIINFETGLKMVKERSRLMGKYCSENQTMYAVKDVDPILIQDIINYKEEYKQTVYVSNMNSKKQIVVSGENDKIIDFLELIDRLGGKYIKLNVAGAFHTPYMKEASGEYLEYLQKMNIDVCKDNVGTVIKNVDASPYDLDCSECEQELKRTLAEHITKPVLFKDQIAFLNKKYNVNHFVECGTKSILKRMIEDDYKGIKVFHCLGDANELKLFANEDHQKREIINKIIRIITCTPNENSEWLGDRKVHKVLQGFVEKENNELSTNDIIDILGLMNETLNNKKVSIEVCQRRKDELLNETFVEKWVSREMIEKSFA